MLNLFKTRGYMCTVTIIPITNSDFILTSNRDESPKRVSLAPEFYTHNNTKLLYPKDELSGGTWIGISEKNRVVCVLNGGFERHERQSSYRKSRGIVANDFMTADNINEAIELYNLKNIEPFTMVIADWNSGLEFYELVWDGTNKHVTKLPFQAKIWSSSTLYNTTMINERVKWFEDFKSENKLDENTILKFHKTAGGKNDDYGVIMNRGFVKTTSITQIKKHGNSLGISYESLQNKTITTQTFNIPQIINE